MNSGDFYILKFPDEILIEIILHLNARDRIPLGYACTKFNSLVFNDKRCYRNLDFSEEGFLTSLSDVQQYLKNEAMHTHVKRINLANMYCTRPQPMLQNITKATNLVELNIIGIEFDSFLPLGSFLDSLEKLRNLSISWPDRYTCCGEFPSSCVEKSFKRLEHLSVRVSNISSHVMYLMSLVSRYCQELEELRLLVIYQRCTPYAIRSVIFENSFHLPPKLKIIVGYNINRLLRLDKVLEDMLPNNERWTQFWPAKCATEATLYYEKDLEVTRELSDQIKTVKGPANTQYERRKHGHLVPGYLLAKAVSIATGKQTIDFQCSCQYGDVYKPMLKVKDIKLLLQNPRHQISYIHIEHDIGSTLNMDLSPFPKLTKLVLCGIIKREGSILHTPETEEEPSNSKHPAAAVDSNPAFKKLVENTSHLKDLTLHPNSDYEDNQWDLTTLHLISGWKELTTLFLAKIPIENGEFLIAIGKQCENLEKLRLEDLGSRSNCCYKNDLSKMLTHCHNLKDFSIEQNNLGQVSEMFTMFTKNRRLRRLRIKSIGENNAFDNLVSPVEGLILTCDLILFVCEFEGIEGAAAYDKLISTLERLKDELNRPSFVFEVFEWIYDADDFVPRNDALEFAHKDLLLPHNIIDALCQLDF